MFKKRHSAMDIANAVAHAVDQMHRTGKNPADATPAQAAAPAAPDSDSEPDEDDAPPEQMKSPQTKQSKMKPAKTFPKGKK